jgi:uncharacterized repeat protein (TIGR02543 family)
VLGIACFYFSKVIILYLHGENHMNKKSSLSSKVLNHSAHKNLFQKIGQIFFIVIFCFSTLGNSPISAVQADGVPTITTSGTLSIFTSAVGSVSSEQSYEVGGTNLTADIVITAPADFEISKTSNADFKTSLSLTPDETGTVADTTIYVHLSSSAEGDVSGNIAHTSAGADEVDLPVTGTVANEVDLPVTSTEVPPQYTLTVDNDGSGSVTVDPAAGPYDSGTMVILTLVAKEGYIFKGWTGTNAADVVQKDGVNTIAMNGDKSITANFELNPTPTEVPTEAPLMNSLSSEMDQEDIAELDAADSSDTCVTKNISSSTDDAEERMGTTNPGYVDIDGNSGTDKQYLQTFRIYGSESSGSRNYWGLRFQLIDVPKGASITSAKVTFHAMATNSDSSSMILSGQLSPNPTTFVASSSSTYNISSDTTRPKTSASISWTIPAWTSGSNYDTPDLSTVVQEIVNQSGWVSGNSLVIIGKTTADVNKTATSYDGTNGSTLGPKLTVCYNQTNPNITTTGSLTAFSSPVGTPSAEQSYTVDASNLTDDLIITAPAGFQISTTSGSFSGNTLMLNPSNGTVGATTIYVRLNPTSATTYSGNITHTSDGAAEKDIAVSGTGNYTLTVNAGTGGGITLNPTGGNYASGTVVTVTAAANTGYMFNGWSGSLTGTTNPTTITMDADKTVNALFVAATCSTVNLEAVDDLYISKANTSNNYGASTTLKASYSTTYPRGDLFKWDINSIPSGAMISSASISLYVSTFKSATYYLYNLRRNWVEGTGTGSSSGDGATWLTYDGTTAHTWDTAGAANTSTDRYDTNLWGAGSSSFGSTGSRTVDLNTNGIAVVQGWIDNTVSNYGLTMQNYGTSTTEYTLEFASSENTSYAGPTLNVTYCIPNVPTITTSGTLTAFNTTPGVASTAQTYTVAGSHLTGDISITAPAGFEISKNGSDYSSAQTLTQSGGSVGSTTIYVRLNNAAEGTFNGVIAHTSEGATEKDLAVNGKVLYKYTLTAGNDGNGTVTLNPSGGIYDNGTTVTLTVTPKSNFIFSSWSGTHSGDIVNTGGVYTIVMDENKTITANFTAATCSTVNLEASEDTYLSANDVTFNNGGYTELHVDGNTGTDRRGTLLKWNLNTIPSNVIVSSASLSLYVTDASPLVFNLYGMRRSWVEGTSSRAASSTSANWNTYDGSNSWGAVGAASTTADRYDKNLWGADASSFTATGSKTVNLNNDGIAMIQGWIDGSAANYGLTIQNYSGSTANALFFSSSEATTAANRPILNVTYCIPSTTPVISTSGSLSAFSSNIGAYSPEQSYTVAGSNLSGNITITPPSDFELSKTSGSGFSTNAITLTQTDGTVASTTIYVRFHRTTAGTSTGNITHVSTGATQVNINVSGTAANGAPGITLVQPADNATSVSTPPSLSVTVTDPDSDSSTVNFYGRPVGMGSGDDFMLVQIPDPQNESQYASAMLTSQMNWIVTNQAANNIVFVTTAGDLVNTPSDTTQYGNADAAFDLLDAAGISYSVGPGNHDMMSGTLYNSNNYFGVSRFSGKSWYKGHFGSDNFNSYSFFSASGMDFILINLQYSPTSDQVTWADGLLKANPDRRGIVVQHDILNTNDSWNNQSSYNGLKDNPNLFMMLCGHMHSSGDGAAYVAGTGDDGHTIHVVQADYQDMTNGNGYLRLYRFSPADDMIYMTTYSPYNSVGSITTSPDQKNLSYDMVSSDAFTLIDTATGVSSGSNASVSWAGLSNSTEYEWYAAANDGTTSTTSSTWSFTTQAKANTPPVATSQSISTAEDTTKAITLAGTDIDGDSLTYSVVTNPTKGTLSGTEPNLTYTPNANANGSDSFTFKVNDGHADSSPATVSITITPVNDTPVANAQSVTTDEDTAKSITLTGSDVEGSTLTYTVVTSPTKGILSGTGQYLTYTPNTNANGSDSFTFKVNDGTVDSSAATVSITITPVNDTPEANPQSVNTTVNNAKTITLSGKDVDEDALTYIIVTNPAKGTLSGTAPNLTYTPNTNTNGSDSFTFKVNDSHVDSAPATVSITINEVNHAPVANAQSVTTAEDTAKAITLSGTDSDEDVLTYIIVTSPAKGILSGTAQNITYTPNDNANGSDSFTFKVNDGTVDSAPATVSITVTPINDAPVANAQSVTTDEDTAKSITLTGSDVEDSILTYTVVTSPTKGILSGTGQNLTYTPNTNANSSDSFTFKVNDGTVDSTPATVSITITPINDAPVITGQTTLTTSYNTALTLTLANLTVTDVDNSYPADFSLTVMSGTNYTAAGSTITPASGFSGNLTVPVKVNDGKADSNTYNLTVTVTASTTPEITTTGTLTAFTAAVGTPSAEQNYSVSGKNLTANLVITAPTDFQVSTTSGSGFGTTATLTPLSGTVSSTKIYIRFNRSTAGTSTSNITHTSTGATTQNVAVSGTASSVTPITFTGKELLGRPTNNSITISVLPDSEILMHYDYGTVSGGPYSHTTDVTATGGTPKVVTITGLSANTKYYYRLVYSTNSGSSWITRDEHSFITQRDQGSTFTFTITSDSHVNVGGLGKESDWTKTMNNVAADHPDFEIDLGDTFGMDSVTNQSGAETVYKNQYQYFNLVSANSPIFLAAGNHEQQEGWHLDDTGNLATSLPVLGTNAQNKFFLNPVPDSFYSGDTDTSVSQLDGAHYKGDYYAFTWGDALFVVINPFWYTTTKPFTGNTGGGETSDTGSSDRWDWTLGLQQFNWLKETLTNSNATYKFVFAHHMVGGSDDYVREGANAANIAEWGGYNTDGTTWAWNANRDVSQWGSEPVHQILMDNRVSAFFHGHDHQYGYEKRDGIVYQALPAAGFTGNGFSMYTTGNGYTIKALPSDGHLRVTVKPGSTTVDYVSTSDDSILYTYNITPVTTTYKLTTAIDSAGSGIITPDVGSHNYASGVTVPVIATPATGYMFDHWSGACSGSGSCQVVIDGEKSVTAHFAVIPSSPITHVGEIGSNTIKDSATADLVVTTSSNVTAGDDILIAYATDPSQDLTISVTDTAGNKYQQAAMGINPSNIRTYIFAAYNVNALSSGSSITIHQTVVSSTAVAARAAVVSVFRGLAPSGALEQSSVGSQSSGNPPSSGAATTVQPIQLLIGAVGTEGPSGDTAGSWSNSFTAGPRSGTTGSTEDTNVTISMGWQVVTSAGSYTAAKSGISSRDSASAIATFKTTDVGISFIGDIGNTQSKTSGTSLAITTNSAVTAGDDILVTVSMDGNSGSVSVSDGINTYNQISNSQFTTPGDTNVRTVVFAAYNVSSLPSGSTITITHPSVTARAAVASEFRGLATSSVVDQTKTGTGTASSVTSGATGTTTQADELLIGSIALEGPNGDAPSVWQNSFSFGPRYGTNYGSTGGGDTDVTAQMGWRIVGSTGAYTAQLISLNTTRDWAASIVTLKKATATVNHAPVITETNPQAVTIDEDSPSSALDLTLHATDADSGDTLTWSISAQAAHGTASASGTGTSQKISYTPGSNYNGSDTFIVQVSDGTDKDTITVNVTIRPVNDAPVITEGTSADVSMSKNGAPVSFNLTLHATDVDTTDILSWSIDTQAKHGTASTTSGSGLSNVINYVPTTGYTGDNDFIVKVNDGNSGSDTITVNVTITAATRQISVTRSGTADVTITSDPAGIDCGNSTTDCSMTVEYGTAVILTATPASSSYRLTGWSDSNCTGTGTCTVTMTAAKSITATIETATFSDVPFDHPRWAYIQALYDAGFTSGCQASGEPLKYCPNQTMLREESAVFMLRAIKGTSYTPSAATGKVFTDMTDTAYWSTPWAEAMYKEGLTAGCQYPADSPLMFCQWTNFTREMGAVFGLRIKNGIDYDPGTASGTVFGDLTDITWWSTAWAEDVYDQNLLPACGTDGSGKPLFCASNPLDRSWSAYMIAKALNLPLAH